MRRLITCLSFFVMLFTCPQVSFAQKKEKQEIVYITRELQKNFYIGVSVSPGTGSNFTRIDWRNPGNKYNYLKTSYAACVAFGLEFRYDLKEKISFQTGINVISRNYRASYSKSETDKFGSPYRRIGFSQFENDLVIPFLCIGRLPINKNKRLYASFTGGPAINVMFNTYTSSVLAGYWGETSSPDSSAYSYFIVDSGRTNVQAMLAAGIGIEKKFKKRGMISLSLMCYTGFTKVYNSDFYFYDTPIKTPDLYGPGPFLELPSQPPAEHDKVFSRNTSLFLKFDYFFAFKKWGVPKD